MSEQKKRAEKLLQMTLTIQETLQASQGPEVSAAAWAMLNLISALAFSSPSKIPFSTRLEGNVLTAMCFRNGPIENVHAGLEVLGDNKMKAINIWSSRALTGALALKEICLSLGPEGEEFWQKCMLAYHEQYCSDWETTHEAPFER